jgi:hypothetical protein
VLTGPRPIQRSVVHRHPDRVPEIGGDECLDVRGRL